VAKNGKGEVLGVVSRVVDFGAHPVLEVDFQVGNEAGSKKELIPLRGAIKKGNRGQRTATCNKTSG
jgi:ribosomal 30S subunit maturation factor RimM